MGWEKRRGKLYYYRKLRGDDGRVRSIYCGGGERGEQAAREDGCSTTPDIQPVKKELAELGRKKENLTPADRLEVGVRERVERLSASGLYSEAVAVRCKISNARRAWGFVPDHLKLESQLIYLRARRELSPVEFSCFDYPEM